jgi:hypothetical protein
MSRFGQRTRVSTAVSAWMPTGDELVVVPVDYLVVAGGGGGGNNAGGGGGGGYRTTVGTFSGRNSTLESQLNLVSSVTYTVTIGAGGTTTLNGSDSVLGTITSLGGGGGGGGDGNSGGCGGGGRGEGGTQPGGAGTAGQGFDGGSGTTNESTYRSFGGGGGAGAAGAWFEPNRVWIELV